MTFFFYFFSFPISVALGFKIFSNAALRVKSLPAPAIVHLGRISPKVTVTKCSILCMAGAPSGHRQRTQEHTHEKGNPSEQYFFRLIYFNFYKRKSCIEGHLSIQK